MTFWTENILSVAVPKKLGEDCGLCFCPPTFTAGTCEAGLECVHNPQLPDLPGKCIDPEGMLSLTFTKF